jgi:hypothetical protein
LRIVRVFVAAAIVATLIGCKDSKPAAPSAGSGSGSGSDAPTRAVAQVADGYDKDALGALRFEVAGGTPQARQHFFQGLLALHSFWYDEATKQFEAAIAADKTFSMAYWGLAMSKAKLLWGDDDLEAGRDALTRMPDPQKLPPREQAWVMAALSLFRRATLDVRASRLEFLQTMEALHKQFPDDESAVFLSIALLSTLQPGAPDEVELRKRAAALAQGVFEHNPKHPGAAHYLIHAYDTPELAPLALHAAEVYATIAPAAFHARHMPAHIFSRIGRWKDAQTSCKAAWDASVAWVARDKLTPDHQDFHSLAWLIEIPFERGRRKDADVWMTKYADLVRAGLPHAKRAAYANQVASYLGRTGEWQRADEWLAALDAPATDAGTATTGSGGAACHVSASAPPAPANAAPTALFEKRAVLAVRARAAAAAKDVAATTKFLGERDKVDAELRPFIVATQTKEFVASSDALRPQVRAALLARAKGNDRALLAALRPLASDQAAEFTGEGTAGGILHAEEIADTLLRLGDAKAALAAYKDVLANHAGRARSLLGAARAAAKAGDAPASRDFYSKLLVIWTDAEKDTDGLDEARAAVR